MDSFRIGRMDSGKKEKSLSLSVFCTAEFTCTGHFPQLNHQIKSQLYNFGCYYTEHKCQRGQAHSNHLGIFCSSWSLFAALLLLMLLLPVLLFRYLGKLFTNGRYTRKGIFFLGTGSFLTYLCNLEEHLRLLCYTRDIC